MRRTFFPLRMPDSVPGSVVAVVVERVIGKELVDGVDGIRVLGELVRTVVIATTRTGIPVLTLSCRLSRRVRHPRCC